MILLQTILQYCNCISQYFYDFSMQITSYFFAINNSFPTQCFLGNIVLLIIIQRKLSIFFLITKFFQSQFYLI